MSRLRAYSVKMGTACLAGVVLVTAAWIVWGILTPGDFFANGSSMVVPSAILAGALGLFWGWRTKTRAGRVVIIVAALLAVIFWIAAPEGWWVKAPPPMKALGPKA
jgi:hypothetical protein